MKLFVKLFLFTVFASVPLFAEGSDSTAAVNATPAVAAAQTPATADASAELKAEIALRDSLMAVQESSCSVEKDSLRNAVEMERAKSANWEQSYNTVKKDNETCAKFLATTYDASEKNKAQAEDERKSAAMMSTSSFLGGLGLGLLIMWLILD